MEPFREKVPCAHPEFEPERYLGTLTSNYVCVACGRSFSPEHMNYLPASNRAADAPSAERLVS